jgi:hypothetical protein
VHNCLPLSYIDVLFRSVLSDVSGDNLGKPLSQARAEATTNGRKLPHGVINLPRPGINLQARFTSPTQSVTIRGVSTKLKVNSGRTNPPGQPSQRKPLPNKRDRPPRWFPGKPCVNTAFESKAKGVAKLTYSDRTSLQIDQDLHPGPRTFALDVLPALLSTYLPAQARQLSALQTGCFVPVGFFVRPTVVVVTGTF